MQKNKKEFNIKKTCIIYIYIKTKYFIAKINLILPPIS